jgi:hypothetical protein
LREHDGRRQKPREECTTHEQPIRFPHEPDLLLPVFAGIDERSTRGPGAILVPERECGFEGIIGSAARRGETDLVNRLRNGKARC